MQIDFSPGVETQLREAASAYGKNVEQLVRETVERMLGSRAEFLAGVQRGIEQADRGELVDHEQVSRRVARVLKRP